MKKYLLIVFCLFCISLIAQVPGYQGKRLIVKNNFTFCPLTGAILGYDKGLDMNLKNDFGVDFVLNRNTCIGFYYDFINDIVHYNNRNYTYFDPCYPEQSQYYDVTLPVDIYGGTYFLSWKKFSYKNTGAIAPLGRYVCMDVGYTRVNISDNGTFNQNLENTNIGTYSTATFQLGMGKQSVLFNRIVVDMGVRAGAAVSGVLHGYQYIEGAYGLTDLDFKVQNKLFTSYLINASIGFGLLVK